MRIKNLLAKFSLLSMILGTSAMMHAQHENSYTDEDGVQTFTQEYPSEWAVEDASNPEDLLAY